MSQPQPACSQCSLVLPEAALHQRAPLACPACQATLEVEVFPALWRPLAQGLSPERIVVDGEASCFYHPEKRALLPCEGCGRFLCALCDLELNQHHFCPNCIQARRSQGQLPELINYRVIYDGAALVIAAAASLLFCAWPIWIFTAPASIFLACLSWYKPGSLVRKTWLRSVIAIVLAVLQLGGLFLIIQNVYFNSGPWSR
jgi:hypothetical protein